MAIRSFPSYFVSLAPPAIFFYTNGGKRYFANI
jgi:hypothetical protein